MYVVQVRHEGQATGVGPLSLKKIKQNLELVGVGEEDSNITDNSDLVLQMDPLNETDIGESVS